MRISARLLRGESQNTPFLLSILLSGRAAGEKKAAAYAKLLNSPKGQGEAVNSLRKNTRVGKAQKKGAAKNRSAPWLN